MATQIHALAFKATVDSSQLKKGMTATRAEFRKASQIMNDHESVQDKFNRGFWELDKLLHKGLITEKQFNAELRKGYNEMKRQERAATALGRAQNYLRSKAGSMALGIGGSIAASLGARKIAGDVWEQIQEVDALNKTAQKLAVPIETLSRLSYVTSAQANMTAEQTGKALSVMSKQISEAARGMGEGQKSLEALGLEAMKLNNLPMEAKFMAIAGAIKGINNEADQLAIIQKIFGEEGGGMANVLRMSNGELDLMLKKAGELGAVVGQVEADKLSEAAQDWADASLTWASAMRDIAVATAPLAGLVGDTLKAQRQASNGSRGAGAEHSAWAAFNFIDIAEKRRMADAGFKSFDDEYFTREMKRIADKRKADEMVTSSASVVSSNGDPDELAKAMRELADQTAEANRIARGGSQTIEPRTVTD